LHFYKDKESYCKRNSSGRVDWQQPRASLGNRR